jgi:hypothetical protein
LVNITKPCLPMPTGLRLAPAGVYQVERLWAIHRSAKHLNVKIR